MSEHDNGHVRAFTPAEGETLDVMGDLVTIVADGSATAGATLVCDVQAFPGPGAPPHAHEPAEWLVVLDGEIAVTRDGADAVSVGRGGVVVIPPGSFHAFSVRGDRPARFVSIMQPAGLEGFFRELGSPAQYGDRPPAPDGPPDVARVIELAQRHGMRFPAPTGA